MVKNIKKSSLEPVNIHLTKLGMYHLGLVCSNADPGLTLTYFTARSNFVPKAFLLEKK